MNTNHVICRNRVVIEGTDVGQFESFHMQATSRSLGRTAVLTLPFYALGVGSTEGRASARIRGQLMSVNPLDSGDYDEQVNIIKVCSQVEIYAWYDTWDAASNAFVSMEEIRVFFGFVEHIADGFPSKVYLRDNAFRLRFGAIEKGWTGDATVQQVVEDCVKVANTGFKAERERLGFTTDIDDLTYSNDEKNVQAVTTPVNFINWGGHSPFDTIQRLMQTFYLYGGVSDDFNVYVGAGVTESNRPIIKLSTAYNVIERNIVPIDGRFVDYYVKVTGILKNGRKYTATGGYKTSKSTKEKGEFEKEYGEPYWGHSTHSTVAGIQEDADRLLVSLKEERNKGKMKLLLYPKLDIMDWVTYTDTVFENLSSGYYILGYEFSADHSGYYQTIDVTDQVFAL